MGRHPLTIAKASVTLSTAGATGTGTSILLPGTASLEGDIAFDLQGVKPFTIELWMRPTSTDTYLDELAFYGKALSAERVKAHFDAAH